MTDNTAASDALAMRLLRNIPADVAKSFSPEQLVALRHAIDATMSAHPSGLRDSIGLWPWRFYIALSAGRERRSPGTGRYRRLPSLRTLLLLSYLIGSTLLALLALYLLKSALHFDIFPHFSLGIWDWFKSHACFKHK